MKKILTGLFVQLFAIAQLHAQTGLYVPQLANFDTAMMNLLNDYSVPGGQLAITYHGRLVYNRGFGMAYSFAGDSVEPNSIFRIASVSKPVTSVAIMKLFENGQIDLGAKVFGSTGILNDAIYQNILDPRVYDITVRELLQHSGGWNLNISGDPMFDTYNIAIAMGTVPPADPETIIQYMLANRMLDFDPGTQYQYSNFGYCVLGKVIEKITGQAYGDYVRNTILIPLGINDMQLGFNLYANHLPNEVYYYDYPGAPLAYSVYDNSTLVPWPYGGFNLEAMDAHGRWVASAEDLCKLMVAVDGFSTKPDILLPATIDTMTKPSPNNPNYALGWAVNSYNNWWHLGSLPGNTAEIIRDGNDQINFAILVNTRTADMNQINSAVDLLLWNVLPTITSWPTFDLFTGIDNPLAGSTLSIFPNPATDFIKISNTVPVNELTLTDVMGRIVYHTQPNTTEISIPVSGFANGIYFIRLKTKDKTITKKFLIRH